MVRKLIQVGDPVLRRKNRIVRSFRSSKIKKIIENLKDSMYKAKLVGIAAPQIGENYMVFLTHPRNTKARSLPKTDKLRVYINPKIAFVSERNSVIYEGCGSVAKGDLFGPVSRPSEIEIEAFDEKGRKFRLHCDGILARVIQHEVGHLMGEEFISKVSDYDKIVSLKNYKKDIRNSALQKKNSMITKIVYKNLSSS